MFKNYLKIAWRHLFMKWWMFGLSAGMVSLIAFFTLSYQGIKSARANPIKSLRTE